MSVDLQKLFEKIDSRLLSNQSITSRKLARELNLTVQDIENAVRDAENVAFSEYRRYRRLVYALRTLNSEKVCIGGTDRTERRSAQRSNAPHATVRYHLYGRGITKSRFSKRCPIKDLSQTGIAFLTDRFLKPDRSVCVLITSAGKEDSLRLEGRIVYAAAVSIANYRYCIGVRFAPFDADAESNIPEAIPILARFEQAGISLNPNDSLPANTAQFH